MLLRSIVAGFLSAALAFGVGLPPAGHGAAADPWVAVGAGGSTTGEPTTTEVVVVLPDDVAANVASPEPTEADVPDALTAVPEAAVDGDRDGVAPLDIVDEQDTAASAAVELDTPIQTVGLTWPQGEDPPALQVRARALDGTWGEWTELQDDGVMPDAGTTEAGRARAGTTSLWVGDADAVQVATVGPAAEAVPATDVRLALIGSQMPADVTARPAVAQVVPFPVVTRAEWGARAPTCTMDAVPRIDGAVVHHTAGSNTYATPAQARQQIRNDQAYHMGTRGWCDLGYNFIVDRWGNIYEGRAGSLARNVIGVHATNYNTGTVGVSLLGNFDIADVPAVTLEAAGRVIGWRLGQSGVSPTATVTYRNTGRRLPAIISHRDVAATACPGRFVFARLAAIRSAAVVGATRTPVFQALTTALYRDLLGRDPEPAGLAHWTAALASGVSQSELVREITISLEYTTLRVRAAYRDVLGREGEPAGVLDWVSRVMEGRIAVDDVQLAFYKEREFYLRAGGTPQAFVRHLYAVMLDRPATASEVSTRAAQVGTRGIPRMVDDVWWSVEAARARAARYYPTFLGREVDPTGKVFWGDVLLRDGEGAVRIGIAGSDEYLVRAVQRFGGVRA